MLLQSLIFVIDQQDRCRSCLVACCHVVHAVANLEPKLASELDFFVSLSVHTMIRSSAFSNPQASAICKIPAGSGFGIKSGVSRVTIG